MARQSSRSTQVQHEGQAEIYSHQQQQDQQQQQKSQQHQQQQLQGQHQSTGRTGCCISQWAEQVAAVVNGQNRLLHQSMGRTGCCISSRWKQPLQPMYVPCRCSGQPSKTVCEHTMWSPWPMRSTSMVKGGSHSTLTGKRPIWWGACQLGLSTTFAGALHAIDWSSFMMHSHYTICLASITVRSSVYHLGLSTAFAGALHRKRESLCREAFQSCRDA